jgi:RNA polymerase sigma-70 factor (ECF subfamily)
MISLFQRLSPRERQLLWLAHVEGLTHRDVATTLGLSEGSVPVLLFRARRRLEALLEKG